LDKSVVVIGGEALRVAYYQQLPAAYLQAIRAEGRAVPRRSPSRYALLVRFPWQAAAGNRVPPSAISRQEALVHDESDEAPAALYCFISTHA
jgi:hypothetical protein